MTPVDVWVFTLDVDEARELLLELLTDDWLEDMIDDAATLDDEDEETVKLDWVDDVGRLDVAVSPPPPPPQAYKRVERLNNARWENRK